MQKVFLRAGLLACLVLVSGSGFAVASEPRVVVTLKPVHSLVAQVMQGVGTPTLIVDGAASPHTFTLKLSAARAINDADVFIRISDGMEPFTRKLTEALPQTVKVISLIDTLGMIILPQRHGDTFEKHEHHDAGHDGHDNHDEAEERDGANDGHIWLDPRNAKLIVTGIAKVLSERYPENSAAFASNAAALITKLNALDVELSGQLAALKGKPFIIFHDATQYFEARYGLTAAGSVTVTPDVQPSAKRLTAIRKKITSLDAVCVFAEPGFQPNLVAAVTGGTVARAGTLDPEGLTLPAGPAMYFDLMHAMAQNLKSCFDAPH